MSMDNPVITAVKFSNIKMSPSMFCRCRTNIMEPLYKYKYIPSVKIAQTTLSTSTKRTWSHGVYWLVIINLYISNSNRTPCSNGFSSYWL